LGVTITRNVEIRAYRFSELFQGFEHIKAVRDIFAERTGQVLSSLTVVILRRRGYMYVDDKSGHINISYQYLKSADERYIYLDLIHELIHVRQFMEGKELFDEKYDYVDRPTELEAYTKTVTEARRIGLSSQEIVEYLKVEWVSADEFDRFLRTLGLTK